MNGDGNKRIYIGIKIGLTLVVKVRCNGTEIDSIKKIRMSENWKE